MNNDRAELFQELYQKTYNGALYTARRYVSDENDLQDILQDSYLKAFEHLDTLKDPGKKQGWINVIVANTAMDFLKKKRPILFSELTSEEEGDEPYEIRDESLEFQVEPTVDRKEIAQIVNEVLDQLDRKYSLVLYQRYGMEKKIREIAAMNRCSENTVKTRLSRAEKQLIARKDEFRKRGMEISGISLAVLLKLAFTPETAYAATAVSSAVFAAACKSAAGESVLGGSGAAASASGAAGSTSTAAAGGGAAGGTAAKAAGTSIAAKIAAVGAGTLITAAAIAGAGRLKPLTPEEKAGAAVIQEISDALEANEIEDVYDIIWETEGYYLLMDLCDENGGSWIYTGSGAKGGIYKVKTPVEHEDFLRKPYDKMNYFLYIGDYKGKEREGKGKLLGYHWKEYLSAFPYYAEGSWKEDYPEGEMKQVYIYPMEKFWVRGNVRKGKWNGIMHLDNTDTSLKLDGFSQGGHWDIPFENGKILSETDDRGRMIIGENEEGELVLDSYHPEYLDKIYGVIDEREECEYFPQQYMYTTMKKFE